MSGYDLFQDSIGRKIIFAHNNIGKSTMARTLLQKLILTPDGRSLYYDLKKDPLEFNDLFNNPDYQKEIGELKESIIKWQGSEKPEVNVYLDENAPVIKRPNVPSMTDNHREIIEKYFVEIMKKDK